MESVRKAAEMVIEEVQFNSKCLSLFICTEPWSMLHETSIIFTHRGTNNSNIIVFYVFTFHDETPPQD